MREIKFRAWDKKFKHWINAGEIRINPLNGNVHGKNSAGNVKEWKLLQYTGLRDKNGKEIYEGDILAGCNGSINGRGWNWGNYEVKYKENGIHNVPTGWGSENNWDSTHWFEVIGNIYENPELLENKNER